MLKKGLWLVFFIALFASSALAHALGQARPRPLLPILSADQISGFTTLENAFEKHCEISEVGHLTGYVHSGRTETGWSRNLKISREIPGVDLTILRDLIKSAESGQIQTGPALCDAGTVLITARNSPSPTSFVIVKAPDCAPSQINLSTATEQVILWVAKQCEIQY